MNWINIEFRPQWQGRPYNYKRRGRPSIWDRGFILYTKTEEGVHAWDLPDEFNPALIDVSDTRNFFRAAHEVLQPMGIPEDVLRDWMFNEASYMLPACWLGLNQSHTAELPLFANLKYLSTQ